MKQKLLICFFLSLTSLGIARAQEKTINGKVTDQSDGSPIAGVSVVVSNTTIGTQTDVNGNYSIRVPSTAQSLVFRFIGYINQTVDIRSGTTFNVTLTADASQLSEVVVTGYGTQRREDITGSIASVKGEAIAQLPVQSFEAAIGGRMAGVQITVPNGVLNNPPVFRIRGTNSISLSSDPLIVVDGVPTITGDVGATSSPTNPLASINPSDIESIDVAKDAAATAIYGSRAANGVVFITTKKGAAGSTKINYDGWVGITSAYGIPEMLNAQQYIDFKTLGVANNPTASNIQYIQTNDANGNPIETKWSDVVYRTGVSHNHNINVSGGNEKTKYYFSTGYTDQEGIIKRNDFKRLNGLFNVNSKLKDYLTVGGKLAYSNEKNYSAGSSGSLEGEAFASAGLGRLAVILPPILSPYNNDGSYATNGSAIGSANNIIGIGSLSYYNPQVLLDLNRSNTENNHIQGNAFIQIDPWEWLSLKSTYGIDYILLDNDSFSSPVNGDGYSSGGSATGSYDKRKIWVLTNTAQFRKTFGEHNISALIGQEQQRTTRRRFGITRQTLSDDAYDQLQAGWVTNNASSMNIGENYLLSVFGSVNYNYAEKYFATANIRSDEYSALGEKRGTFWGASLGWEIAKEDFWSTSSIAEVVSSLRLRGSYGKVGNVGGIGDYTPYSTYSSGLYGGDATLYFANVGNSALRWETSSKTDVGINFGLFNDKVTAELAYYNNDINNLILRVPQAPSTGLPSGATEIPQQNVGTMYNRGFEAAFNIQAVNKPKFQWTTNINFTYNKNEVTSLAPGLDAIQTETSLETVNQTMPGYSLGYLWVVRTGGVDPETGKRIFLDSQGNQVYYQFYAPTGQYNYSTTPDGTTRYVNPVTGGSAISSSSDAVMYANSVPKYYGGWNNTFRWGNFDMNVLLTYQLGFSVYYGTNAGLHDQRWWNTSTDVLEDGWFNPGDQNKIYAKPVYNDNVSNGSSMPLDINVFKGDFLKLKNLTIGYTLPPTLLQKMSLSSLRIYVSGQNLAILTGYPGPDPEVSSNGRNNTGQGVDRNTVVNGRTFTLGLSLGL